MKDKSLPPSMRCLYTCEKKATGAVDRRAVLKALRQTAMSTPDKEERVEFVPGTVRGKRVREKMRAALCFKNNRRKVG